MRILRDLTAIPREARGSSLAIGNFDGLHPGHHAVLRAMHAYADARGAPRAVLTFAPHPRRVFSPDMPGQALEPFHLKARRFEAAGVEWLFCQRFDREFAGLSAQAFIDDILIRQLEVAHVATGENFVFGHRRSGNSALLATLAHDGAFAYTAVPPVIDPGGLHASTRARAALAAGDVGLASTLLGRPYELLGRVQHGAGRGKGLGYPTLNLVPGDDLLLPAYGVYAVRFALTDEPIAEPEAWRDGVANLGVRPTFGGEKPWLEVHSLSPLGERYGERLRVRPVAYLRPERKFDSPDALREQIGRDVAEARIRLALSGDAA